jgi:hypothetical protein
LIDVNYGLQNSQSLWFDTNDVLYICNGVTPGFISSCTLTDEGRRIDTFTLNYQDRNLSDPVGIISDNLNNLYIANYYPGTQSDINGIISVSPSSTNDIIPRPDDPYTPTLFATSSLIHQPFGIALDTDGNLFNSNFNSFSVLKSNTHNLEFINANSSTLVGNSINTLNLNAPYNLQTIEVDVACFTAGTLILTVNGYVKIEELKIGDVVKTFGNILFHTSNQEYTIENKSQEGTSKITGIGKTFLQKLNNSQKPIFIKKDTFEKDKPFNNTYFSKQHIICYNDKFDHCKNWVNNTTIYEDSLIMNIEYYHIQLEDYYLINANGILAETYYDKDGLNKNFDIFQL